MHPSTEEIQAAIKAGEISAEGLHPAILLHREVDHTHAVEYTACYVNDSWASTIREKIAEGFTAFRIQSEFAEGVGHVTKAYMVKLKTN